MRARWHRPLIGGGLAVVLVAGGSGSLDWVRGRQDAPVFARIDRMEESYLQLAKTLKTTLDRSAQNLRLPDFASRSLFAERVEVRDLGAVSEPVALGAEGIRQRGWEGESGSRRVAIEDLSLWESLWREIDYLERAKFYIHMGGFADDSELRYQAGVGFEGLAWLWERRWAQLRGRIDVMLERDSRAARDWRITRWESRELESVEHGSLLFSEVLDRALPEAEQRRRARRSLHQELVLDFFREPDFEAPNEFFTLQAFDRHPGLAVNDFDGDGDDDLYAVTRWGRAQLFRQQDDGRFHEAAGEAGIDLEGHASSAIFADFDNDGDADLFVGRTLEPSRYFVNEGGVFEDRSADLPEGALPFLVSSVNAVDYDGDGLLDVYFSTYAAAMAHRRYWTHHYHGGDDQILPEFLSRAENLELSRRFAGEWHDYQNRVGPPNVLLHNRGRRRFERVRVPALEIWRNSYQTTWADFDGDGDADCYVANDFAKNHMLRNEGEGVFVDVTEPTGTADIGFGMGAAWGDYDNDGDDDLYVTNMFSKAGQRIVSHLPEIDPSFANMARGNTLFRNDSDRFKAVSGLAPPALTVERAGWAWGGQFFDADNDGCLDLYSLSGFYTAPDEVAIPVDT